MNQPIVGFDQDELGDWRAILVCGHRQHVRHNPPFVERPWVLCEEGRQRYLGVTLDCKLCEEGEPTGNDMLSAEALETIYGRFRDDLYRFIQRRVPNPAVTANILQDVIYRMHAGTGDLSASGRLEGWLNQLIHDAITAADGWPRPQARQMARLASDRNNEAEMAELATSIRGMLDCLPGLYRQALILDQYRGLNLDELAGRLDLTRLEAQARLLRAREKLREALLDFCHFQLDHHGHVLPYQPYCAVCSIEN